MHRRRGEGGGGTGMDVPATRHCCFHINIPDATSASPALWEKDTSVGGRGPSIGTRAHSLTRLQDSARRKSAEPRRGNVSSSSSGPDGVSYSRKQTATLSGA